MIYEGEEIKETGGQEAPEEGEEITPEAPVVEPLTDIETEE